MKTKIFTITVIIMMLNSCSKDNHYPPPNPNLRYFKFSSCDHTTYWQNTFFIAATSDPIVIKQCLDELILPVNSRTLFPLGIIKQGNGGYNNNGAHNFNWHYVDASWELVEVGIEIYDGCAYSEAELDNYANTIGRYGGWNNRIVGEIYP
ncbi:hypothetical protein [Flavobacterium sp.]|uniref:BP74-related protein n=1 Tax=Flavobacterium sp. TaxID=239 RepID=UPI00286CEF75|nr:hypothetical protein [Flavobacterium sp.]